MRHDMAIRISGVLLSVASESEDKEEETKNYSFESECICI